MKSESDHQLELFAHSGLYSNAKKSPGKSFFTYVRDYERVMLIILGIVMTGLISFSLGVEKGKRLAVAKLDSAAPIPQKAIVDSQPREVPLPKQESLPPVIKKETLPPEIAAQKTSGAYTVQLASYKTRSGAQKEAQELKRKGFSTIILAKGSYVILCVGNFSTKDTAKQLVLQLKNRYKDCYVRRL